MHSLVNMYLSLYQSYPLVSLLELNIWQSKLALHHCCQPPYLLLSGYNFMSEDNIFSFPLQSQYLLLHLSPNYCFSILKLCHLVLQLITVYAFCHLADDDLTEETTNCHQCMIVVMVIHAYYFDNTNAWLSTHWQNRVLTAIHIVICNMLKLPSKRYLKSETFSISVHMYNQNKKSKGYAAQYLTKETCDVTRGQSLTFLIMSDPPIHIQILDLPQLIPHFGSPLADGLEAVVQLIIILILSTCPWARALFFIIIEEFLII